MEANPYHYTSYDQFSLPWEPQHPIYEGNYSAARMAQRSAAPQAQESQQAAAVQKPKVPKAMPKPRALAIASTLKRWVVVTSLAAFVSLGGLATLHHVGTTASTTSSTSTSTKSTTTSSQQSSSNVLKQSGGTTVGTTGSSQNTSSSSTSSSSTAVSGSSVS